MSFLEKAWYKHAGWLILLWPVSLVFQLVSSLRRASQQVSSRPQSFNVPVIVIGNISVGGTGKTPLLMRLVEHLSEQGLRPGVVSRGYGGSGTKYPLLVDENTQASLSGDEALLIARNCACPVVIDPDRNNAVEYLLSTQQVDVVLSDDGLQHYKLYRDLEIAVVDGKRWFGNAWCLPAGPLREPPSRLDSVDYVVVNGRHESQLATATIDMEMRAKYLVNLVTGEKKPANGAPFNMGSSLQAVCAIGHPDRFFTSLEQLPYPVSKFIFPDHHNFSESDFDNAGILDGQPIVMTEKDAVKCQGFAKDNYWFLKAEVELPDDFLNEFTKHVKDLINEIK